MPLNPRLGFGLVLAVEVKVGDEGRGGNGSGQVRENGHFAIAMPGRLS